MIKYVQSRKVDFTIRHECHRGRIGNQRQARQRVKNDRGSRSEGTDNDEVETFDRVQSRCTLMLDFELRRTSERTRTNLDSAASFYTSCEFKRVLTVETCPSPSVINVELHARTTVEFVSGRI